MISTDFFGTMERIFIVENIVWFGLIKKIMTINNSIIIKPNDKSRALCVSRESPAFDFLLNEY